MKRKKAVDEQLAVVKEEIAARAESGMTELALTREKEARQIVLLTLAKMHKELMNDHNKREPKIDLSIEKLNLESLNIAYWQETLAKSSMVKHIFKLTVLSFLEGIEAPDQQRYIDITLNGRWECSSFITVRSFLQYLIFRIYAYFSGSWGNQKPMLK